MFETQSITHASRLDTGLTDASAQPDTTQLSNYAHRAPPHYALRRKQQAKALEMQLSLCPHIAPRKLRDLSKEGIRVKNDECCKHCGEQKPRYISHVFVFQT